MSRTLTPVAAARRAAALPNRIRAARVAAWIAVALFVANFVVAMVALGDTADHAGALGAASEGLVGAAFLAGAACLALMAPRRRSSLWWLPAIVGLAASGITMLWVAATGSEPAFVLFLAEVALIALGLIVVGVLGARAGCSGAGGSASASRCSSR
ncbi:hypothetical protein ACWGST_12900 [Agromyces sp. NPDC055520]